MLLHKHLLVKAYIKKYPSKNDCQSIENWVYEFIVQNGMKTQTHPKASYVEDKGNRGVTCICSIKTSHLAFHIWEEVKPHPLLQFDFYTCGKLDVEKAINLLKLQFDFESCEYLVLDRSHNVSQWYESHMPVFSSYK